MNTTSTDPFSSANHARYPAPESATGAATEPAGPATDPAGPGSAGPGSAGDGLAPTPSPGPKKGFRTKLAAGLLTVGLLAAGGFALIQANGSSAATSAASGAQGGPGGAGGGPGFGGGAGAPASGTVSAVSATSISVKTTSGTTTYKITSAAVVENNGATSTAAKLTVGEKVIVFTGARPGTTSATTSSDTASRIMAGTSATMGAGAGAPSRGAGASGQAAPTAPASATATTTTT